MPAITDPPPAGRRRELVALGDALDATVPAKRVDRNLLIATWNLRHFGAVTEKWHSEDGDEPKRDLGSLRDIAEIISRFDVIAVQEAQEDITCLRYVLRVLGDALGDDPHRRHQGDAPATTSGSPSSSTPGG